MNSLKLCRKIDHVNFFNKITNGDNNVIEYLLDNYPVYKKLRKIKKKYGCEITSKIKDGVSFIIEGDNKIKELNGEVFNNYTINVLKKKSNFIIQFKEQEDA